MDVMSAKDAAESWSMSTRRVVELCSSGRIPGAMQLGNTWAIPKDSEKPKDARVRSDFSSDCNVKPIIKWAGGKGQLLEQIRVYYPKGLGTSIKRYAEPFIGGAAVLLDVLSRYDIEEAYVSDVNRELIYLYQTVRDDHEELIEMLSGFQTEHLGRDDDGRKAYFLENRRRYNDIISGESVDRVECAALFIYLNKTCFNGLYRVNSKGEFNVPSGVYKNPLICDSDNITNVSRLLQGVEIRNADYRQSISFIDADTFVYFDPPYRPLTVTSSFTSYTKDQFDDDDQRNLADYARELDVLGAKVMVSNSDPKNSDPEDDFFEEIYSGMVIHRVSASRMINSKGTGRGKINELLITNYRSSAVQSGIADFL